MGLEVLVMIPVPAIHSSPRYLPTALVGWTGSRQFLRFLSRASSKKGLRFGSDGIFDSGARMMHCEGMGLNSLRSVTGLCTEYLSPGPPSMPVLPFTCLIFQYSPSVQSVAGAGYLT